MQKLTRQLNSLLSSDKFFVFVVILLVVQAVWIALSAQYPLAFDEDFHFGVIQLYSHQWSPLLAPSSVDTGVFGAITRDPSYLYHYLMSFPYRLIALFTQNEVHQIILLRLINIALFSAGLVVFRSLLLKLSTSRKLTNFSLLMLVAVPVVPFLAAHINYDNLLFLLVPSVISLAVTCGRSLQYDNRLPVIQFSLLVILSLITTLVKYVFLPILAAICLYLLVIFWQQANKKASLHHLLYSFQKLNLAMKVGLIAALLVSGSLFVERDVVNIIEYGKVSPACSKVASADYCSQSSTWARDQVLREQAKNLTTKPDPNPIAFSENWAHDLLYRLYFAINYDYSTKPPLLIPYRVAAGIGLFGLLFLLFWGRSILRQHKGLLMPLMAVIFYAASLFYLNYTDYLKYGERVAVNGRYFIPLLPFIFVIIGLAYNRFLHLIRYPWSRYLRVALVVLIIVTVLQGGGLLTFLAESEPDWYWQDATVISVNQRAQQLVTPFILGLY